MEKIETKTIILPLNHKKNTQYTWLNPAIGFSKNLMFFALPAALIWYLADKSDYNWQWYRIVKYIGTFQKESFIPGPLLKGLWVTLQISVISLFLSCLTGLITAVFRLSPSFALRAIARIYLEVIRNTPLIVQIFFLYFVLSPVLGIERFTSAVLALSLFEGAYASEIIRAGIVSVSTEQWEAAASIGLKPFRIYRHIVLPQAIPVIIPPLAGQMISLIKDSALVSTIALYDLTMEGQMIIAETYMVFEIWFAVAVIYIIITAGLSIFTHFLEKKFSKSFNN
ncbi:ABC-type amino acid transport system, permease component [Desulfamplus magnetovallimortis]|uniref:ABC-type amino acid transport system, permease component n=1 Tax=Desulfamplus magnetovallimortis TaxID=1246637 RepID=A0A1W1HAZ1_9BACT|nr:amino acid ABC transporter permease [Desulfamplus magnetovallimortis]SLM29647.1 ABC-type amino acid transport system, permease component [Desulfamplus magnetovallimortis]